MGRSRRSEWSKAWSFKQGQDPHGDGPAYNGDRNHKRELRRNLHKANRKAIKEALHRGEDPPEDYPLDGWEVI